MADSMKRKKPEEMTKKELRDLRHEKALDQKIAELMGKEYRQMS